jgi:hypothetical protein
MAAPLMPRKEFAANRLHRDETTGERERELARVWSIRELLEASGLVYSSTCQCG